MLFFLYALKYSFRTSILVVPTIALMEDQMRRAQGHGISCSKDPSTATDERLVVVTPEGALSSEVRNLLIRLHSSDRLGVIFIDEAHVFSTECEYRPRIRLLPQIGFLPSARFVLLTATCPQWVAEDILKFFFGPTRPPVVLRDYTNRLNIRYEVDRNGLEVSKLVKCTVTALQRYGDAERIIVYAPSLELVDVIKHGYDKVKIPCDVYSGQRNPCDNHCVT